jgi:hypothetical protein
LQHGREIEEAQVRDEPLAKPDKEVQRRNVTRDDFAKVGR